MYKKIGEAVVYAIVFVATLFVTSLVVGLPTMWLVNYLFSSSLILSLFGTVQIGFWKAFWLVWLCGILIKGSSSSSSKD